jgi:probable HAF family extracellular repeat protein
MQSLGILATTGESFGSAISQDGGVIVGTSDAPNRMRIAFRWTAANGMQTVLGSNPYNSAAAGISANGDRIVVNLRRPQGNSFVRLRDLRHAERHHPA